MVVATVFLSEITKAWMLYLGLIFLFMVMYAPGGIASLIMMNLRLAKYGKLGRIVGAYLALAGTAVVMAGGAGRHGGDDLPPAAQHRLGQRAALHGQHAECAQCWQSWLVRGPDLSDGLGAV